MRIALALSIKCRLSFSWAAFKNGVAIEENSLEFSNLNPYTRWRNAHSQRVFILPWSWL